MTSPAFERNHEHEAPRARLGLAMVGLTFLVSLAASAIATVDVVATARGRVVPGGRARPIVALDAGVVRAIHVREGSVVNRGDPLIDLDASTAIADRDRAAAQLILVEAAMAGFDDRLGRAGGAVDAAGRAAARRGTSIPPWMAALARSGPRAEADAFAARLAALALVAEQRAFEAQAAHAEVARRRALRDARAGRYSDRAATLLQMERARAELAASSAGEADGSADPPPAEIAERSGRLRSGRAVSPSADLARAQRLQLASSLTEWRNHLRAAEAAVAERRAAADIARAELARAETAAALASETYAARRRLLDAGAIAELDAREAQSRAVEAAAAADAARIRVRQELAASEAAARRVDALRAERRRRSAAELSALALRLHDQIADAEDRSADDSAGLAAAVARRSAALAALAEARAQLRASRTDRARAQAKELIALASQAATLRAELTRAEHGVRAARLIAPIDGVAQQVGVHGPGAAVMPGQALLVVIPRNGAVEIEAWFANRDAAHVRAGQEVDVRADALPFTRFGVSRGIVAVIASNAVDLGHVGAAYPATIRLIGGIPAGADPSVANRLVPGMTVSVDAKITRRRVLDFVLSPILETLHSAARVR